MTIVNKIFKYIHCVHMSNNVIKIHSMYVKWLEKFPKHIWRAPYVHEYLYHKRGGILWVDPTLEEWKGDYYYFGAWDPFNP
jgi:hypothetical protein